MRSATLLSMLVLVCSGLAACAGSDSSPAAPPASDAGGTGNVGSGGDAGTAAGTDGGSGSVGTGGADAGTGAGSDAGPGSGDAGTGSADAGTGSGDAGTGSADAGTGSADAGTGSADAGTGSADAGTGSTTAYCDPALSPAAGFTISGTNAAGSCAGLAPSVPTCAADIVACSGEHLGLTPTGNTAGRAESDGAGALALQCVNVDVGPSPGFALYRESSSGYTKGAHLGDTAVGLPSGFAALSTSYNQRPPPNYDFFAHDGTLLGYFAQGKGQLLTSAAVNEFISLETVPTGLQVFAQQVARDGSPIGSRVAVSDPMPSASNVVVGGAADDRGGTLVVWGLYGQSSVSARWLDSTGQPVTPAFSIALGLDRVGLAAGLTAGNGVALGWNNSPPRWSGTVAPGATSFTPAPAWLASRQGEISLVRGGRALAFTDRWNKTIEVVAPDGTSCGKLALPGFASVGADGTVFAATSGTTFRVYPQLLH